MTEERWHNFAKEKPSEDMEGRNFIVSNGHYEKITTWCGYWENEPFMGDRLCDEVVHWKFYFTPEEEKANEATRTEPKPMKCDELKQVEYPIEWGLYYDKDEVDKAIAELKDQVKFCSDYELAARKDIKEMRGQYQMLKQFGHYKLSPVPGHMINHEMRQYVSYNVVCMIINHLESETKKLKAEIESLKASHYAESVDAGMRERRLRRALYKACANWAKAYRYPSFRKMERKCRAKAEGYK